MARFFNSRPYGGGSMSVLQCNSITNNHSIRVALYARVSSEQQAQAGTIDSQVAAIMQRLQQDDATIDDEARFIDEGHSGATLVRPALERLRDLASAGGIDRLYVLCPDRLARSYAYQMLLVDELQRCGVELVFVNRDLGKTPEDHLLLQVQGMVAEYERAKIIERCRRGKLHAARHGSVNVLGGAPYGYRYVAGVEGAGTAQYNVHLEEAAVVQQIFQWIAVDRLSIGQLCKRLKSEGILSPRGKGYWDRSTVWALLKNPAYKGAAAFGKTRMGPMRPRLRGGRNRHEQPRNGQSCYDTPTEEWISIAVPAIVEAELFDAVARQLEENQKRSRQGRRGARYLLQGLLQCKCCGYAYYGKQISRAGGKGQHRSYGYYRCVGTDAYRFGGHRVCCNEQVRQDLLDQAVWDDVRSLLADPMRVEHELHRRLDPDNDDPQRQADRKLNVQIDKLRRGIGRLIDAYGEGLLDKSEFEPRISSARQRLSQLQDELQSHIDKLARARELRLVIDNLEAFAQQVTTGLDHADWDTRREVIRTLVKRVEIDQDQVKVVYRVDINPFDCRPERGILHYCRRRDGRSLRRAPALVPVAGCPMLLSPLVLLLDRSFQPHLDQMQHRSIDDSTSQTAHQLRVRDGVEVSAQVGIHHLSMSARQQPMDMPHGIQRAALGAVGVLLRRQVGLEDRLQHQHRRHLHDTIFDRWDSQRPALAVRLGDIHPPHGLRTIRLASQFLRQFTQPPLQPVRFDALERLPIYARCALIGFAAGVGMEQNVFAVHLVVQGIEAITGRSLRFGV